MGGKTDSGRKRNASKVDSSEDRGVSITRLTQRFILEHPSIRDCLRKGLLNYSALARMICTHYDISHFDGVLVAARRYHERLKGSESHEERIRDLFHRTKLHVRTQMAVTVIQKGKDLESLYALHALAKQQKRDFHLIEGEEVITLITEEESYKEVSRSFRSAIKGSTHDLVQVTLVFPRQIETTYGVVAHLYGLLAESGINVLEEMSCWTEVMMVIKEEDLPRVMKVLKPTRGKDG